MPRGIKHEPDIDYAIAELFGGIRQQIIFFAAETGASANWVAQRISTLLSPPGERVLDSLPAVQREAPGARGPVEPLALAEHAHSSQAPAPVEAKRGNPKVKEYWAKMSPAERGAEMMRRMKKGFDGNHTDLQRVEWRKAKQESRKRIRDRDASKQAVYKARASAREKGEPLPPLPAKGPSLSKKEAQVARHRVYVARHYAKKKGLPMPPLPPQAQPSPNETV